MKRPSVRGLDDEIAHHLACQTQANIERGMAPEEAIAAARRRFGNITLVKEEVRAASIPRWLQQIEQDLRFGWRMLSKSPGFAVSAILTLGLGIGANTALFSVVHALLVRSLPYENADRFVQVVENLTPNTTGSD